MSELFPLGYAGPTSLYLLLYLVTWVAHFFLISAVLGGALYAGLAALGKPSELATLVAASLPLVLGLAITAGVAPLLFIQLLYQHAFYTANLLLYVRFLAIVPALMACFYLFYFARTPRALALLARWRAAIHLAAAALALFVALSWAELHTLTLEPATWVDRYQARSHTNLGGATAARLAALICVAVAMTSTFAAGLSRFRQRDCGWRLARTATAASIGALLFASIYALSLPSEVASALGRGSASVHLVLFAAAAAASAVLWSIVAARRRVSSAMWRAIAATSVAWLWSLAVVREAIRAERLNLAALEPIHRELGASGGYVAFVVFGALNAAAIAWCVRVVVRAMRRGDE